MVWHELVASPGGGIDPEREQERRLAAQARAGAEWALTALIARYQPAVVRYLVRLTGSTQRGQTLAQQVFVRMGKRLRGPHGGDHLRLWLLRAATEMGLEVLRHPTRGTPARLTAPEGPVALLAGRAGGNPVLRLMTGWGGRKRGDAPSRRGVPAQAFVWQNPVEARADAHSAPADEDEQFSPQEAIRHRMVRAVLAELPYGDAQCLALHLVAGLNQSEVAQALGVTPAVARRRIVQGLQLFGRRYDAALASLGLSPDFDLSPTGATSAADQSAFEVSGAVVTVTAATAEQVSVAGGAVQSEPEPVAAASADQLPPAETLADLAEGASGAPAPSVAPDEPDAPAAWWVDAAASPVEVVTSTAQRAAEEGTADEPAEAQFSQAPEARATAADEHPAMELDADVPTAAPVADAAPVAFDAPPHDAQAAAHIDAAPASDTPDWDALLALAPSEGEQVLDADHVPAPPAAAQVTPLTPEQAGNTHLAAEGGAVSSAPVRVVPVLASQRVTDEDSTEVSGAPVAALGQPASEPPEHAAVAKVGAITSTLPSDRSADAAVVVGLPRVVPVLASTDVAGDARGDADVRGAVDEPIATWDTEPDPTGVGLQAAPGDQGAAPVAASPMLSDSAPDHAVARPEPGPRERGQQAVDEDEYILVLDAESRDPGAPAVSVASVGPVEPAVPATPAQPTWRVLEARRRRVLSADGEAEDPDDFPF